jgi:hypothetical protein
MSFTNKAHPRPLGTKVPVHVMSKDPHRPLRPNTEMRPDRPPLSPNVDDDDNGYGAVNEAIARRKVTRGGGMGEGAC